VDGRVDFAEVEVTVGESLAEGGELFGDCRNGAVKLYLADEDLGGRDGESDGVHRLSRRI
jgi:hypothetical protein